MTAIQFPILLDWNKLFDEFKQARKDRIHSVIVSVPWAMVEQHEAQALTNHGQTLKELAQRGGLSNCEMVAVLKDRKWSQMEPGAANRMLASMINVWVDAELRKTWTAADMEEMGNDLLREAAKLKDREYLERVASSLNEDDPARAEIERSLE